MVEVALPVKAALIGLPPAIETGTRSMRNSDLSPIDKHVGSRVRMRRLMLDMSQTEVAEALGLTFQQVQKYEKGVNRIGAGRLFEVSRILGVPIDYFYEGVNSQLAGGVAENEASPPVMEFVSSGEGLQLSLAFMKIKDPKLRKRVLDLVKQMAEDAAE